MFGILAKPNVLNKDAMKSLFKEYEHKFDKNNSSLSAKEYAEVDMLGDILNTAAEGDYDTDEESEDKDQSPAATVEEYAATATGEEQSLNVEEYEATATSEEQSLAVAEESLAVDDYTVTATDLMPVVMGSLEMDDDLNRLDENDIVASMGLQHSSGDHDSEPPTKKRKTGEVLCTVCGANCAPNRPLKFADFPNDEFKSKYPVGTKLNMCNICGKRLPIKAGHGGVQVREEDFRRCRTFEELQTLILSLNGRRKYRKTKKI